MKTLRLLGMVFALAFILALGYVEYLKWDLSSEQILKVANSPDGRFEARLSNTSVGAAPGAEEVLLIRIFDNRPLGRLLGRAPVVLRYSGSDPDELSFRWIADEKLVIRSSVSKKLVLNDAFDIKVSEE